MTSFKHTSAACLLGVVFSVLCLAGYSQDAKPKAKPVKKTFDGMMLGDNQTVMVPVAKTLELDIMHRFGTWEKGYEDFFGLFAPSNIRLGASYSIRKDLNIGMGITKANMIWDFSAKYALIKQTKGKSPVSITYYADANIDTRKKDNFVYTSDRFSYFHQLIIARKITDKLSLQLAPSVSHINNIDGYYTSEGKIAPIMKHEHIALSVLGRYKLKETMAVFFNYDQPITRHVTNNPHPNIQLGFEMTTSAHSFQFFAGNYISLSPVRNNMFNKNDFSKGEYLIGFNITRLWIYK
jgi:hypothetical protein